MRGRRYRNILLCMALHAWGAAAFGATEPEKSRGELLYTTYCIACHTTHVHWREKRLANDWSSLTKQVRRWQANALLGWDEQDIREVATYLNALYYHFPPPRENAVSQNTEATR